MSKTSKPVKFLNTRLLMTLTTYNKGHCPLQYISNRPHYFMALLPMKGMYLPQTSNACVATRITCCFGMKYLHINNKMRNY